MSTRWCIRRAQRDALTASRHRAFIAPRLLGSIVALAALPLYIAMRGVPSVLEVLVFAWLVLPMLTAYYLSRTGQYESAHVLSALALTGLVTAVAAGTGGISSFAAIWLVIVPLEASLSASRRVVALASTFALVAAGLLHFLGHAGMLPPIGHDRRRGRRTRGARRHFGGALCHGSGARRRVAGAHELLAALRRGGPLPAPRPQHDRRHHPARPQRRGAVRFARRRSAVRRQGERTARPPAVRPRARRRPPGLSHRARRCRNAGRGALGRVPRAARAGCPGARLSSRSHRTTSGSRCAAARSIRPVPA